jgi:PKD repeat protein
MLTFVVLLGSVATAGAGINLSLVPSRMTGAAPLTVFFDATGTADTLTPRPFHDVEYRWDFGDPGSGVWHNGSRAGVASRNTATGAIAAHLFETPGIYTVSLTALDGTNSASASVSIVVQDPEVVWAGTMTVCFSTSGDFTGAPAGARQVVASSWGGTGTPPAYAAAGTRILLRRGETWVTAAGAATINAAGPGFIGAFGSGPAPRIQAASDMGAYTSLIQFGANADDWRVADLELDGAGNATSRGLGAGGGSGARLTLLRLNAHDLNCGVIWTMDDSAIFDSTITRSAGSSSYGAYILTNIQHFAFLGNFVDLNYPAYPGAVHDLRFPYLRKGVVSANTLMPTVFTTIKMHAPSDPNTGAWYSGQYSEMNVVSDNRLVGSVLALAPQNNVRDERVRDVIVERNWFDGASLGISAASVTVRNNVGTYLIDGNWIPFGSSVRGIEPAPTAVRIYHNSVYTAIANGVNSGFSFADLGSAGADVVLENNLAYAPFAVEDAELNMHMPIFLYNAGMSPVVSAGNSSDAQIKATSPGYSASAPSQPFSFQLVAGSYALRAGTIAPVFSDFTGALRASNGGTFSPDMGAFAFSTSTGAATPRPPRGLFLR